MNSSAAAAPESEGLGAGGMSGLTPLHIAEAQILDRGRSLFGLLKVPAYQVSDVSIENGFTIHTVKCTKPAGNGPKLPPMVLIHGYGGGVGMWYATLPLLSKLDRDVFAIDTMGCGLSSRPVWELPQGIECDVQAAEGFFVERMEQWRAKSNISKMVLCGHSLGGYLSVAYAERYCPERCSAHCTVMQPTDVPYCTDMQLAAIPYCTDMQPTAF